MAAIDDINRAIAILKENRKQIICPPKWASAVRQRIHDEGLEGLVEIVESVHVPEDQIYIFSPTSTQYGWQRATAR